MLENIYTTKMSSNKKLLQNRFSKIRSAGGKFSKLTAIIMSVFVSLTMIFATVVAASLNVKETNDLITLYSKGSIITLENKPIIQNNIAYFPLRETFEKLGVFNIKGNEIMWDNGSISIKIAESEEKKAVLYTIKIGSDEIDIKHTKDKRIPVDDNGGIRIQLMLPEGTPILTKDKTYVPYTFIEYMLDRGLGNSKKSGVFDFMFTINTDTPSAFLSSGIVWPCDGEISLPFGERTHPITKEVKKHNGIDIVAPEGTEVRSAIYGTVTDSGYNKEKGYYVIIERDNIQTVYSSLTKDIPVKKGDEVLKGQIIGKVGKSGTSTGAHIHFEILINKEYYNPELIY